MTATASSPTMKPILAMASSFAAEASSCIPWCTNTPDAISVTGNAALSARPAVVPKTTATASTRPNRLLIMPKKNRKRLVRRAGPTRGSAGASVRGQKPNRIVIRPRYHAIAAIFETVDLKLPEAGFVGWVEQKRNPSPAVVAMGFADAQPILRLLAPNHVTAPERQRLRGDGADLVVLSRRRGVARRAGTGRSGLVVVVAGRPMRFVADRLALLVHRLSLMLSLERARLR